MIGSLLLMAAAAGLPSNCNNAQTQTEINVCAAEDYKAADAQLNRQRAQTSAIMKEQDKGGDGAKDGRPGYHQALLDAQRAWLGFRDAHCRIEGYAMRGGSGEAMLVSGCLAEVTRARTAQLKALTANYQQ